MKQLLSLSILLLYTVCTAHAIDIHRFEYFGTESGLSQNTVNCLLCDSRGFLWVGTNNGLNRYDGVEFRLYSGIGSGLSVNSRIEAIWEDSAGYVWAKTYDGSYEYFDQRHGTFGLLPDQTAIAGDVATCFAEARQGLVLVGTNESGIYCLQYNVMTEVYDVKKITIDSGDEITGLLVDSRQNLWVQTSAGVVMFTEEQVERGDWQSGDVYFRNMSFTGCALEVNDRVLLGTKNHGIQTYDQRTATFGVNQATQQIDDNENASSAGASGAITRLISLPGNKIFVSTSTGHAYWMDGNLLISGEIRYARTAQKPIEQVFVDRYEQLWLTTADEGTVRVDMRDWTYKYYQLTPDFLRASVDAERPFFYEDRNDNMFIATHGAGLLLYDRMNDKFIAYRNSLSDPTSISSNIVHCLAEDHSGQLWLGTGQYRGGLVKVVMDERTFRSTTPDPNTLAQSDNIIRCTYEDPTHQLWVATKTGRIFIYNDLGRNIKTLDAFRCTDGSQVKSVTYHMMHDREGYLWVCTKGAGVFVSTQPVDFRQLDNLRFRNLNASNGLSNNNAYRAVQDEFGNVWVATYGNGLNRIKRDENGYKISIFNKENSNLPSDKTRFVMVDSKKDLWIATINGVARLDVKMLNKAQVKFENYVHNDSGNSLTYNDVCYIFEDHEARKYFATMGGGLNMMTARENSIPEFTVYTTADGLCNNVVHSITEDNNNNIWISTENGISCMDKDRKAFVSFNDNNGLFFNGFSEATCTKLHNGKIVFGGYLGFVTISPQELTSSLYKGKLLLTSFKIANKEVEIGEDSPLQQGIEFTDRIDLEASQSNITIGFRLLDFLDPENTHYAYMLEGFEDTWNSVGNNDFATYTNLPAGEYTFHVKCTYRNGEWSDETTDLAIIVHAPLWRTPIAFALYAIFIGLLVLFISKFNTNLEKYQIELSSEKKLTDSKLQFFTNIAHEIRTPLTLIVAPLEDIIASDDLRPETKTKLQLVQRNANRILRLINQLLDFRKIEKKQMHLQVAEVDMGEFVTQVGENFRTMTTLKKITYTIDVQPHTQKVWVDPIEMDTVIYNLLSNAVKFTENGRRIDLKLEQDQDYTYIIVSDEGCGIKDTRPEVLFKRFTILSSNDMGTGIGLSLSREIVEMHGGQIVVESEVDKGSTFTVKLRNGSDHLEGNEMITFHDISEIKTSTLPLASAEITTEEQAPDTSAFKTVLLVEDSLEILNYLSQALSGDFNCLKATNGREALDAMKDTEPDLIITDLMMPVMSGEELIKTLKTAFETSHIPIIALTAKASIQDQANLYELGVDGYIAKPFSLEQIRALSKNLLRRREKALTRIIDPESARNDDSHELDDVRININIEPKDKEFIRKLIQFIEENHQKDLSIDEIASEFAMSRTVFYNKVKGLTSQSPLDFIRKIKFRIAEDMLKKGFSVAEVAFKIGYTDTKYFSKQFKQYYGLTPSQVKGTDDPTTE